MARASAETDKQSDAERAAEIENRAVTLLARREHAPAELRAKLEKRGFERADIEPVLAALADDGRLSTARYAEAIVTARVRRGAGPAKIRADLAAAGVDDKIVAQALAAAEIDWVEVAAAARAKRFGSARPDTPAERARETRFLQRRGFSAAQIGAVLRG